MLLSETDQAIDLDTLPLTLHGFLQFRKMSKSPSKMVCHNVKCEEGIPAQYLCVVW